MCVRACVRACVRVWLLFRKTKHTLKKLEVIEQEVFVNGFASSGCLFLGFLSPF